MDENEVRKMKKTDRFHYSFLVDRRGLGARAPTASIQPTYTLLSGAGSSTNEYLALNKERINKKKRNKTKTLKTIENERLQKEMLRLRNISKLRIAKRKNIDNPSLPLYTQPLTKRINHSP